MEEVSRDGNACSKFLGSVDAFECIILEGTKARCRNYHEGFAVVGRIYQMETSCDLLKFYVL